MTVNTTKGMLGARRPSFTLDDASRMAAEHFGIACEAITSLPSYADQNFLIRTRDARYVLKVAHAAVSVTDLELQQAALTYLAAKRADFARVLTTNSGSCTASVLATGGGKHHIWMLTYLEGSPLGTVRPQFPHLLYGLGVFLGGVDRDLAGFAHPHAARYCEWDLLQAATLRKYLPCISDENQRTLVAGALDRFESRVLPKLLGLRKSIIHNDANDYNVLVAGAGYNVRICGLLDFGDMVRAPLVCEVAIAATYVMLSKPDPVGAAVHVVRGYHKANPLLEVELELLHDLIIARLCSSVLVSAYRTRLEPENAYLRISEEPAWELLQRLCAGSRLFALYRFREACGLPVCPPAVRTIAWLKKNAGTFASVTQPDVRTVPPLVLDLSVGNPQFGMPVQDVSRVSRALFAQIRRAGARVGVGRYDEPRLVYTSAQFWHSNNEYDERRTIHLGIDLFQEAGTPVYAPLDGVVHRLQKREQPLDYGGLIILRHEVDDVSFYTLYGHLSHASVDALQIGTVVLKGQRFASFGHSAENGGWVPHLHFQVLGDLLEDQEVPVGVAPASQRAVWLGICPDPNLILGIPGRCFPPRSWAADQIGRLRKRHVGTNLSLSYRTPLHIVRGFRQHLYDTTGRAFLDAVNNVPHVGHCHPRVVRAAQRQQLVLNTNTRYLHEALVRYAQRLAAKLPDPLNVCFFVNSGSEANDLALRLAHAHTNARGMVVLEGAYHGHLSSLISISPYKFDGPGGKGAPSHVQIARVPDTYRGPYRGPDAARRYAESVGEAIQRLSMPLCAFICESMMGCGGQVEFPPGYLQAAYALVRQAGGVCIADEVQVGFGRVGSHFWGFETQGVIPDIIVLGKPMGNGHPLAGVVTTRAIADSFDNGMEFFSTCGGNPVSCAVGLAVLDVIEEECLQANALNTGRYLHARLKALQEMHPVVGSVRGRGLFLGMELVSDRNRREPAADQAAYVVNRMCERGVLISTDGPYGNVLKIKPPMVFVRDDADQLASTLEQVLAEDFVAGSYRFT